MDAFLTVVYGATAWVALTAGTLAGLTVAAGAAIRALWRRTRTRRTAARQATAYGRCA